MVVLDHFRNNWRIWICVWASGTCLSSKWRRILKIIFFVSPNAGLFNSSLVFLIFRCKDYFPFVETFYYSIWLKCELCPHTSSGGQIGAPGFVHPFGLSTPAEFPVGLPYQVLCRAKDSVGHWLRPLGKYQLCRCTSICMYLECFYLFNVVTDDRRRFVDAMEL